MDFITIPCPTCGRAYSPERWLNIADQKPNGLALLWESFGRGTLNLIKRIFDFEEVEEEIEPVKQKLLKSVQEYYRAGVISRSDLSDLLNDLLDDDDITAHTVRKPTFTPGKTSFYDTSRYKL